MCLEKWIDLEKQIFHYGIFAIIWQISNIRSVTMTTSNSIRKYPLLGTHFVLDEEKILRENKYDLAKIYEAIDEIANKCGMIKIDKNTYHCKGDENDLADLWIFVSKGLVDSDWFSPNIKQWQWLSEKEGDGDLISYFKKENRGIWQ